MSDLTSTREREILTECQAAIGYTFRQPELLRAALTHTSGANTRLASNERMEFLGDSVFGMVVCESLYQRFPDYQEGEMTKVKSAVVSRRACTRMSRTLGLHAFLFVGKGVHTHADMSGSLLADVYESLIAAIYLDGGLEPAREFIIKSVTPEIDEVVADSNSSNCKSVLQQLAQKEFGDTPLYRVLDEQGPDHNKCFKVAAEIDRHCYPAAWGRNKKEAEAKAAMNALAYLKGDEVPYACE